MEWLGDGRRRRAGFDVVLGALESARQLRTALDPDGDWVGDVLRDAHARLVRLRAGADPTAGGLVVAIDKEHAERLRARLSAISGAPVEIVTSDALDASARTELFFRQVVGRFVRRTVAPAGEQMSHVFLPSDPRLKVLAAPDRGGARPCAGSRVGGRAG
jgi:hypothetical protein